MLDINIFRNDRDGEVIKESQRRRFRSVEIVDQVINLYEQWRARQFDVLIFSAVLNRNIEEVRRLKSTGQDASEAISQSENTKKLIAEKEIEVREAGRKLNSKLQTIGNLVHDSVPINDDEANNAVMRSWGEKRTELKLKNHVELVELLGIADLEEGADVAGGRGFYLKGDGVLLNKALINFELAFLGKRGYTMLTKCAQLAQFDEELHKVTGEGADKFLIANAEQPLCAYHVDDWIHPTELPIRYAGYSSCFRKDAGAHGRDTLGIFRVEQFEKVEQFCLTSPNGNDSWDMHEEMMKNSEDFYKMLKIPYQVVAVVSGALNHAAAKKYDLEGWFPASETYRELVSCSNYTDYQARRLEIRYGQSNEQSKQYVHLLKSTLTATEKTICCILENYQKEDGVEVPEVLREFMGGKTFLPFKSNSATSEAERNIRVFCRCRPLNQNEIANGCASVVDFDSSGNVLELRSSHSSKKQYKFDHVFTCEDNQEAVFAQTKSLVISALDGSNVCILAYGQTGSGKTYTMEGSPEQRGVNYRVLEKLFHISVKRNTVFKYNFGISMFDIYNDKIRDLLAKNSDRYFKKLEVEQTAAGTQEVPGLVETPVYGTEDVWALLESGSRVRSVGATNANKLSSRSHCLLRITVMGENLFDGLRTKSHLWLVDLAGSERLGRTGGGGERLKESMFINKSLSALGNVIYALVHKIPHVPYRDSKLTHILQSSLGGDCKTLMFVHISPSAADVGETICSLKFANRVRGVKNMPARKQVDQGELIKYKQMEEKVKQLEKEKQREEEKIRILEVRLSYRDRLLFKNLQKKIPDLENNLAEEREKIRQQEERFSEVRGQLRRLQ